MSLKNDIITRNEAMRILRLPSMTFNRMRDIQHAIPFHTRKCGKNNFCKYYRRSEIEALLLPPPHIQSHPLDHPERPMTFYAKDNSKIRTIAINNEFWFVAKDVCMKGTGRLTIREK